DELRPVQELPVDGGREGEDHSSDQRGAQIPCHGLFLSPEGVSRNYMFRPDSGLIPPRAARNMRGRRILSCSLSPFGTRTMDNNQVAAILDEIGTLLELQGESSFRCNAYHNGARVIANLPGNVADYVKEDKLGSVPGIGTTLREKITTLVTTGNL